MAAIDMAAIDTRRLAAIEPDLVEIRRDLHRHPELGFAETRTAGLVTEALTALGLDVRSGVGGTGVLADLDGARPGLTLLLRADMDALPLQEETGLPFASETPGAMHACGHDAHVAALLGVAMLLSEQADAIAGRVRFCFQPAEEVLGGARAMIADGAMDGVDRVLGAHVLSGLPFETVIAQPGPFLAGCDFFRLTVEGRAGHGGMPHLSVDPIFVAAQVVTALQAIVARETRPGEPLVVNVGAIEAGSAANVIVERVTLRGTLRWFAQAQRERALERIEQIATDVCRAHRAEAAFAVTASAPVTVNAEADVAVVEQAVAASGRAEAIRPGPLTASDDVACFLERAPGAYVGVGCGGDGAAPHHHPRFEVDERAIGLTTELLARATMTTLGRT